MDILNIVGWVVIGIVWAAGIFMVHADGADHPAPHGTVIIVDAQNAREENPS